jgi:hypothetical protein
MNVKQSSEQGLKPRAPGKCAFLLLFLIGTVVFAQEQAAQTNGNAEETPARTQIFSMENVGSLAINYQADFIVFLESENEDLVVKEYLGQSQDGNSGVRSPYAEITNSGQGVAVQGSARSVTSTTGTRLEVYIPQSYRGAFLINSGGGTIRSEVNLDSGQQIDITINSGNLDLKRVSAGRINITMTSGTIRAEKLAAAHINVRNTSGMVDIGEALGALSIESSSGPIIIRQVTGYGSVSTQSGTIELGLLKMMGDLSCAVTIGNINITTPRNLSYNLDAEIQGGMISVIPPDGTYPINSPGAIRQAFGPYPDITITARVFTGTITVSSAR